VMTVRNEDAARAFLRLRIIKQSIDATGEGDRFSYFVLSDSDRPGVIADEEALMARWCAAEASASQIHYRRRMDNAGFKAGNLRDFAARFGTNFELMLTLDADSLMTGDAVTRLVRVMQAHPRIGILQSLVVGMPSSSPFARLFQFGMRLGMRTYTMGQAWWVGDCGPYWGHNALLRIKPYLEHCNVEGLIGDHQVLSHDQVEAVLMRRAGFEVRVLPVELGSYEDNPPDLIEFVRRDGRWCRGNLQYLGLLGLKGLQPVSRFQLSWAILMFLGVPAWMLFALLLPPMAAHASGIPDFPWSTAAGLYLTLLAMQLSPKLAGIADAILTPGEVRRFGGGARFAISAALEIAFTILLGAITTVSTSLVMLSIALRRPLAWNTQRRDGDGLTWRAATAAMWPVSVFGLAFAAALVSVSPAILLWSLPLTAGFVLAIPFAVVTASPTLGGLFKHHAIAAIPEDVRPVPEVSAVQAGART
jgi:membrane glycosyltransferase